MRGLLLAVFVLSGCAAQRDLARTQEETRALAQIVSQQHIQALERQGDILNQLDGFEHRLARLERRFEGAWDREECERYSPEAQKAFCHRRPMVADKSFEELAAQVAREVDAEFCKKAVEPWQVKAFCRGKK